MNKLLKATATRHSSEDDQCFLDAEEPTPAILEVLVKGAYFRGADVKAVSDALVPGDCVTIEHEPENQHDEYACKVLYEGIHIGYVQSEYSSAVFLQTPCEANVVGHDATTRNKYPILHIAER